MYRPRRCITGSSRNLRSPSSQHSHRAQAQICRILVSCATTGTLGCLSGGENLRPSHLRNACMTAPSRSGLLAASVLGAAELCTDPDIWSRPSVLYSHSGWPAVPLVVATARFLGKSASGKLLSSFLRTIYGTADKIVFLLSVWHV